MDSVNLIQNIDGVNMGLEKKNYHHGNLRSELKNAALEILDEEGVEAVSIRKVARNVGVAHSAPANHFKDKKALLTALAIDIFKDISTKANQELTIDNKALSEKIHVFSNALLKYGTHFPNRYRLLWRRDYLNNDDQELNDVMDLIYNKLLEVLSENQNEANVSIESQAIALWSMIHGYITMRLDGNLIHKTDEKSGADRQLAIIDVLLNGLKCD